MFLNHRDFKILSYQFGYQKGWRNVIYLSLKINDKS